MKISVVLDCYNAEGFVSEAIASVLAQTRLPDEFLIVDDGSTDGSVEQIRSAIAGVAYARLIERVNGGQLACLTTGITEASGDLIALLDGDDMWTTDHLAIAEQKFEEYPDLSMYYCDFQVHGGTYEGLKKYSEMLINSTFAVTYLGEAYIGNVTSTLVLRSKYFKPYLPLPKVLEAEWIRNADNPLVWMASLSGTQKYCSSAKNVLFRIHDNNLHKQAHHPRIKCHKRLATKRLFEHFRRVFYVPDDLYKCLMREHRAHPTMSPVLKKDYYKASINSLSQGGILRTLNILYHIWRKR